MTVIKYRKSRSKEGMLSLYLSAKGHADYDVHGKDIVCSAVSCLCISLANTLMYSGCDRRAVRLAAGAICMDVIVTDNEQYAEGAFDMAVIGLKMIALQYPENVKIKG